MPEKVREAEPAVGSRLEETVEGSEGKEKEKVTFVFPGRPLTKSNVKIRSKSGRYFLPKKYKVYEEELQYRFLQQKPLDFQTIRGDVKIVVKFYFPNNQRRDVCNYQKSLMDSMTGFIWMDDSQITEAHLFKFVDRQNPRIELTIL